MIPSQAYTMWRTVARIRRQEGDLCGARQAARNARIYANRNADGTIRPPRYRIPKRLSTYLEMPEQTDVHRYECSAETVPIPFETATSTVPVVAAKTVVEVVGTVPATFTEEVRKMAKNITPERQVELDFLSNVGASALSTLPEHTFKSESVGRTATGRVVIDGTEYSVFLTVVNRSTVKPKSEAPADAIPAQESAPVAEPVAEKPKRVRKSAAQRKAEAEAAQVAA